MQKILVMAKFVTIITIIVISVIIIIAINFKYDSNSKLYQETRFILSYYGIGSYNA